jgi:hypothetical protein
VGAADAAGIAPVFGLQPIGDLVDAAPLNHLGHIQNVVESAGGGGEVGWAAGMLVTGARWQTVVTTDRGRSWLPEGVLLPADVEFPWQHAQSARWEGLLDPARVIVEYAAAIGATVTALASTRGAPLVAAGIPFTIVDPSKRAHRDKIDGAVADRVRLQVDPESQKKAKRLDLPDSDALRDQARNFARGAVQNAAKIAVPTETYSSFAAALEASGGVPANRLVTSLGTEESWARLRDEYNAVCVQEAALREDARDTPIGELDTRGGQCRPLLATAYVMEAILAIRHQTGAGAFNSAFYSWDRLNDLLTQAETAR